MYSRRKQKTQNLKAIIDLRHVMRKFSCIETLSIQNEIKHKANCQVPREITKLNKFQSNDISDQFINAKCKLKCSIF